MSAQPRTVSCRCGFTRQTQTSWACRRSLVLPGTTAVNDDGRPFVSRRALADLSNAGFSILQQPSMQVNFEVHHVHDRPGYLIGLLTDDEESTTDEAIRETLSASAYGGGLVVVTRSGQLSPQMRQRQKGGSVPAQLKIDREKPGARTFRGSAVPNLTFLYEASDPFDGIICIENEPHAPQFRHGQATRELLTYVSGLAQEHGAPLLTLQSPTQLPPHRHIESDIRVRSEEWPRAAAIAARFAFSMHHLRATTRLDLAERLSTYCAQRGYGFWLRDARPGYKTGNWFIIRDHDRRKARQHLRSLPNLGPQSSVSCALQSHSSVPLGSVLLTRSLHSLRLIDLQAFCRVL